MGESKKKEASGLGKALVFKAGENHWACELSRVKEIVRTLGITGLPNAISQVEGVINVRGEVVPVLNLWQGCDPGTDKTRIESKETVVILRTDEGNMGLKVSDVASIEDIQAVDPEPGGNESFDHGITSCRVHLSQSGSVLMVDVKMITESIKAKGMGKESMQHQKGDVSSLAGGIQ